MRGIGVAQSAMWMVGTGAGRGAAFALGCVALTLALLTGAAADPAPTASAPGGESVAIAIKVHPQVEKPEPPSGGGGPAPERPMATPAAGPAVPARGDIALNISRGQTLRLGRPASSIFVADPAIADIQTPSNQVVFVFGKKAGRTSLFALDALGEPIAEYGVAVTPPIEDLRGLLRTEVGDERINVAYTPNGAVLSGSLPNAALVESAKAITAQFLGAGATVTNRLRVSGALQVNLQVRVAEVRRSVLKEFGININARTHAGAVGFTVVSGGRGAAQETRSSGRTNSLGISYSDGINSVSATLDALAESGLVTILAEPNLTAISGEKASFLAGGEIPIPVAQGLGQTSVQFRRFGASLEFQPTVLSNNLINIHVRPEVSEITPANGIDMNGVNIPGLTTRSADTVVELASGQSFAIGGLIRKTFGTNIGTMPGIGDIPILGALFRSSAFQKEETELVIIVTPTIVRAAYGPQALEAPTDRLAPPTDAGRVLLNTQSKAPANRRAPRKGSVGLTGDAGLGVP